MQTNLLLWSRKMKLIKKILLPAMASMFVFVAVSNANAARRRAQNVDTSELGSIIFRIENIKPIKDKDDNIKKCSFVLTTFNRMDKALNEATMEMEWEDNITGKYTAKLGLPKNAKATENESGNLITTTIKLSNVQPHIQKSFIGEVETDKCFLLFDTISYQVSGCVMDEEKVIIKDGKAIGGSNCSNNFNYINSKNPEYYAEFKDVPESVLQKQAEDEKNLELAKINSNCDNILADLKKTDAALSGVK